MTTIASEQRRKKEAIDTLISDIAKGTDDNVSISLRIAIEVSSIDIFENSS